MEVNYVGEYKIIELQGLVTSVSNMKYDEVRVNFIDGLFLRNITFEFEGFAKLDTNNEFCVLYIKSNSGLVRCYYDELDETTIYKTYTAEKFVELLESNYFMWED